MQSKLYAALVAGAIGLSACGNGQAAESGPSLTVYQSGAAVVADSRAVRLTGGKQSLTLAGLPEHLKPDTLWLAGDGVALLASGYRGTAGRDALLRARVGEQVTLLRDDGSGGDVERKAKLIVAEGRPLVRVDNRLEWIDAASPWRIALPAANDAAAPATPGLALTVNAKHSGKHKLNLIYQVDGLTWQAAYVARMDTKAGTLDLQARATLTNNSGGNWQGAKLTLVAGDVNRSGGGTPRPVVMRAQAASAKSYVPAQPAFDYYRYKLPARVNLGRGEQRSVALFDRATLNVAREYRIAGGWRQAGDVERAQAQIRVHFKNTLDQPLPAGALRVYAAGDTPMLLGESNLPNTPKGAQVELVLGRAFDITAERTTTDTETDGKAHIVARRIVVHNAKDSAVPVQVVEALPGDWQITRESDKHSRLDANHAAWNLTVPAGGRQVLTYRVRYR